MPTPKRPRAVPAEAVWSDKDREWIAGQMVDGKRHGTFRFFRADGTASCESTFEHGVAQGPFVRFHNNGEPSQQGQMTQDRRDGLIVWQRSTRPTTEITLPPQAGETVWKACSMVEHGLVMRQEFYTRDEQRVTLQGLPIPPRPADVPPEALYDSDEQYWQHGLFEDMTGKPMGTQREWTASGALWTESEWVDGEKTLERVYYEDGTLHREHHYADGDWTLKREFDEEGRLKEELEVLDQERLRRRQYYCAPTGEQAVRIEWIDDGELVTRTDYYEGGEVLARHEPRGDDVFWRTEYYPSGARRAEGEFGDEARGLWSVYAESGELLGQADCARLNLAPEERVFEVVELLLPWQQLERPAMLDGLDEVDWESLDPFHGDGENVPFYLLGLTATDDAVFEQALTQLTDALLDQQTISEPAGPAAPFIVKIIAESSTTRQVRLMERLLDMLTRDGDISAAFEIKSAVGRIPNDADVADFLEDEGIEPTYLELINTVSEHCDLWARWIVEHEDREVRRHAARLLPFALGARKDRARRQVLATIDGCEDRVIVGDLILTLVLLQPITEETAARAALQRVLKGGDPALRFCAAQTLFRLPEVETPDAAIEVVLQALRDPGTMEPGLSELYFAGWDVPSDVGDALSTLEPDHAAEFLPIMIRAAQQLDAIGSFGMIRAMLDIAFPEGYQEESLSKSQREVLQTVVQTEKAWSFRSEMLDVLVANNLPTERLPLKQLAERRR